MKFNMVCIKFDQKIKKNLKKLNFGLFRFFRFFLKPKKPSFFRSHFPALSQPRTMAIPHWLNHACAHGKYPFTVVVDRACTRSI